MFSKAAGSAVFTARSGDPLGDLKVLEGKKLKMQNYEAASFYNQMSTQTNVKSKKAKSLSQFHLIS